MGSPESNVDSVTKNEHSTKGTVAFLGLGILGRPMAMRLAKAGFDLVVWNRTSARADPLLAAGARLADSPAEAATAADTIVTMLADPAAVTAVFGGPRGVAATARPGTRVIQMSTVGPAAAKSLAAMLPAGVTAIDAPVGGSVGQAETGELKIFASGADADLDAVDGVLAVFGEVRRCGAYGQGSALKLVVNNALVATQTVLAETLSLAAALGVSDQLAREVLSAGPLAGALKRAGDENAMFPLRLVRKDLALIEAVGGTVDAARAWVDRTVERYGPDVDLRLLVASVSLKKKRKRTNAYDD